MGNPEGKRSPALSRRRWEDSIELDLKEIGLSGMDWIDLAQDGAQPRQWCINVSNQF
jgi:hypothetical protein